VTGKTLDLEALHMRKLISLALVLLAAGALAAWASAGNRHRAEPASGSSIAAIANASHSWAEFSARIPDLPAALARESQDATLAGRR
jgi:hypothetical protein